MIIPKDSVCLKGKFGKTWLLLFHHNSSTGDYFENYEEIEYINTTTKFSIFGFITEDFKIDGQYEFLLEYPELSGYNKWKQTEFPTTVNESYSSNGYDPLTCDCTWSSYPFSGLSLSNDTQYTFLDASNSATRWYFSIGAKRNNPANNIANTFPGPKVLDNPSIVVSHVFLWLHISNFNIKQIYGISNLNNNENNYFLSVFIYIFILTKSQ